MLVANEEKDQKIPCFVARSRNFLLGSLKTMDTGQQLPGKHIEESLYDLLCERYTHLYSKASKQSEEEAQHLISHI